MNKEKYIYDLWLYLNNKHPGHLISRMHNREYGYYLSVKTTPDYNVIMRIYIKDSPNYFSPPLYFLVIDKIKDNAVTYSTNKLIRNE